VTYVSSAIEDPCVHRIGRRGQQAGNVPLDVGNRHRDAGETLPEVIIRRSYLFLARGETLVTRPRKARKNPAQQMDLIGRGKLETKITESTVQRNNAHHLCSPYCFRYPALALRG